MLILTPRGTVGIKVSNPTPVSYQSIDHLSKETPPQESMQSCSDGTLGTPAGCCYAQSVPTMASQGGSPGSDAAFTPAALSHVTLEMEGGPAAPGAHRHSPPEFAWRHVAGFPEPAKMRRHCTLKHQAPAGRTRGASGGRGNSLAAKEQRLSRANSRGIRTQKFGITCMCLCLYN